MGLDEGLVKVWVDLAEETQTLPRAVLEGLTVKKFLHHALRGTVVHSHSRQRQVALNQDRVLFEHREMRHHLPYQ